MELMKSEARRPFASTSERYPAAGDDTRLSGWGARDRLVAERQIVDPHPDGGVGAPVAGPPDVEISPGPRAPLHSARIGSGELPLVENGIVHFGDEGVVHAGAAILEFPFETEPFAN